MNVITGCGGSVDKVRLPYSYWQTLLFVLFWGLEFLW